MTKLPVPAGIDAEGLPKDLDAHHLIVNSWQGLEDPQNVCIVSIASLFDASLAPPGQHVVHVYCAANEPWGIWEGQKRATKEYRELKVQPSPSLLAPPAQHVVHVHCAANEPWGIWEGQKRATREYRELKVCM